MLSRDSGWPEASAMTEADIRRGTVPTCARPGVARLMQA